MDAPVLDSEAMPNIYLETKALVNKALEALGKDLHDLYKGELMDVLRSAYDQETFAPVKTAAQRALERTRQFEGILQPLLTSVEALETRRVLHERFGPRWWAPHRAALQSTFAENPLEGLALWLRTYAEALLAWELHICAALAGEDFSVPAAHADLFRLFRNGARAMQQDYYTDGRVLSMLDYLVQAKGGDAASLVLDPTTRAALLVFRGRIKLHYTYQKDAALRDFEAACECAPQDALPIAALGEYQRGLEHRREAEGFFRQAVEVAPSQPHGHLGLGLCAEDEKRWDEASEWFDRTAERVRDEKNPLAALSRLFAPVSGNACLRLACTLQSSDPTHALEAIERALSLSIKGDGEYPSRVAYRLKGDILAHLKRHDEAAKAYFEAGRRFLWDRDSQTAKEILRKVGGLAPRDSPTHWELADVWLLLSYSAKTDDEKKTAIESAKAVWYAAARHTLPDEKYYWAYLTRALLTEQEVRTLADGEWRTRASLLWQATSYVVRSLLLRESRGLSWALLTRYYRELGLENNALSASARAMEIDLDHRDPEVLEERLIILTNTGDWAAANALIDQHFDPETNSWAKTVQAFIRYDTGDYNGAIKLINDACGDEPTDLWVLEVRALAYSMLSAQDQATADWQQYYRRASAMSSRVSHGFAAYKLGKYQEAVQLLEPLLTDPFQRGTASRHLVVCHVLRGDFRTAMEHLTNSVRWSNRRELNEFLVDLLHLKARIPDSPFGEIERAIQDRLQALKQPLSLEQELLGAVREFNSEGREDNWVWIGVQASLASICTLHRRWSESASIYQRLLDIRQLTGEELAPFPEARLGLRDQVQHLQDEGDKLAKSGKQRQALGLFMSALLFAQALGEHGRITGLESRLIYAHFEAGDFTSAREYLAAALCRNGKADAESGTALGTAVRALVPNPRRYYVLQELWEKWERTVEPDLQVALSAARKALSTYLDQYFQLALLSDLLPVTTPIVVELSKNLVPKDTSETAWPLLKDDIPKMRESIQREMGVRVPSVRIRKNEGDLSTDSYVIMLNEIPLVLDCVHRYKSDVDPLVSMTHRLEALLRQNLREFLGLQEIENILEEWRQDATLNALIEATLPDQTARIRFTRLLRALVRELVPLTRPQCILAAIQETRLSDNVSDCLRAVRLRLKDLLPGNQPHAPRIEFPADLEDAIWIWLWQDRVQHFLAAPPEDVQEWLRRIRELVNSVTPSGDDRNVGLTLVTRQPAMRLQVQKLVELEFPHVMTLSREELLEASPNTPAEGLQRHA